MSVLRPRLDVAVVLNGQTHRLATTIKDQIEFKGALRERGREPTGDAEDVTLMAYFACRRKGVFDGTWEQFLDACDDIEASEPPPLTDVAASPDSSPPPPELPAYHLENSLA